MSRYDIEFFAWLAGSLCLAVLSITLYTEVVQPVRIASGIEHRQIHDYFGTNIHPVCYMFPKQRSIYAPCRYRWGLP